MIDTRGSTAYFNMINGKHCPCARVGHTGVLVDDRLFYIFGGDATALEKQEPLLSVIDIG